MTWPWKKKTNSKVPPCLGMLIVAALKKAGHHGAYYNNITGAVRCSSCGIYIADEVLQRWADERGLTQ